MTPTVGIQMVLVLVFSFLTRPFFRFNTIAAILPVYVSNPFTVVPIYYFNYWIGTWFVDGTIQYDEFAKILEYEGFAEWWDTVVTLFVTIGWPLIIGSFIVATACTIPTYPAMLWMLRRYKRNPSDEPDSSNAKPPNVNRS